MNYLKHYELLISRARQRHLESEFEKHHIIPRCMGGDNTPDNLVKLTVEEHYVAHQLLVKIYPGVPGLVYAANMMTVASTYTHRSNKRYGWLRKRYISECRKRIGESNSSFGRKWYHCPATGKNGKFRDADVPSGWLAGRVPKSKSTICIVCGKETGGTLAKWCKDHRPKPQKTVFRTEKIKAEYSDDEKKEALIRFGGNIRRALLSLGLNDSGSHYRKMKKIKASLYPPATNRLKG
jgi:hypothetical protein